MDNDSQRFDVLVIGAGPAGMAAAVRAAECAARVGVVDDNAMFGGQIWRGSQNDHGPEAERWRKRIEGVSIAKLFGQRIFQQPEPGVLLRAGADTPPGVRYA